MQTESNKNTIHERLVNTDHNAFKVVLREPFPAFNTTTAFICDKRTLEILLRYNRSNVASCKGIKISFEPLVSPPIPPIPPIPPTEPLRIVIKDGSDKPRNAQELREKE